MQCLYLCEKPSQAQDLAQVLGCRQRAQGFWQNAGGQLKISWAIGHLLEQYLPDDYQDAWKQWQLSSLPLIPEQWKNRVRPQVKAQYQIVSQLIKECQQSGGTLVLATDYDREGEAIGRELLQRCRYRGPVQRLKLSALDPVSIQRALAKPLADQDSLPLFWAAQARQRADWLVGMNFSRLFTLLAKELGLADTYHVGRVSAPTIALVVEREREISQFVAKDYQQLSLILAADQGTFRAQWQVPEALADEQGHCQDAQFLQQLAEALQGQQLRVTDFSEKEQRQAPPLPLDLTSLQRWADQQLRLSAEQSLKLAQGLYDKKLISYPRTECRYLPQSQRQDAPGILAQLQQHPVLAPLVSMANLQAKANAFNDGKMQGEAHHGIIPTLSAPNFSQLSAHEQQMWLIIAKHYLAQFFADKVELQQKLSLTGLEQCFIAKGKKLLQPGWLEVLRQPRRQSEQQTEQSLPPMTKGRLLPIQQVLVEDKKTQPPAFFTEASLLSAMENIGRFEKRPEYKRILKETSGLGTPATRHEAIKNALDRGYLRKDQRQLRATARGQCLYELLPPVLRSPGLTASWEQKLKEIEQRQFSQQEFEQALIQWLSRLVEQGKSQQAKLLASYQQNPWIQAARSAASQQSAKSGESGRRFRKGKTGAGRGRKAATGRGKKATTTR